MNENRGQVSGDVALGIGNALDQPRRGVRQRGDVVQRVGDLRQLALGVIGKL